MTQSNTAVETRLAVVQPLEAPVLTAQMGVDKADIIDIGLVKQEERLDAAKRQNSIQTRQIQEEIKQDEAKLQTLCQKQAKDMDTVPDQAVAIALKANGYGAFVVSTELQHVDETKQRITVKVTVQEKQPKKGSYSKDSLDREVAQPFCSDAQALLKSLRGKREHLVELNREAADIHRGLSNMNALARKMKATLAEHRLAQSEEGRAILAQIQSVGSHSLPKFLLEAKSAS